MAAAVSGVEVETKALEEGDRVADDGTNAKAGAANTQIPKAIFMISKL